MEGLPGRCTVVLATLGVVLLVTCGCCNLDYVPNHDIVVLKLAPNGALEWTRTVDHGFDDAPKDLTELPGGGYAIAGKTADSRAAPSRPLLVRLSPDGAVMWERLVTDGFDVVNTVVPAGDGGTAVLTGNGTVVRFAPDGQVLWARPTGIPEGHALLRTGDGGFLAGGRIMYEVPVNANDTAGPGSVVRPPVVTTATAPGAGRPALARAAETVTTARLVEIPRRFDLVRRAMVVRLAPDGAITWERQYDEDGLMDVLSLAEGTAGSGFLLAGEAPSTNGSYTSRLLMLHLAPDGTLGPATPLGETNSFPWSVQTKPDPRGYRALYQPTRISQENYYRGAEDAVLAPDGSVLEHREIDASLAVTWAAAGGYFSVGVPSGGNGPYQGPSVCGVTGICTYTARTFDNQGAVVVDRTLSTTPFDQVTKVVQTADGGYALLAFRNNPRY